MSDLNFNKIAAAVLATGLAILGLRELSDGIYATKPAAKAGYAIQVAADTSGGDVEVADTPPDWGTVLPAANVAAGEEQSKKCLSCHTFAKGGPNLTGPDNWDVVGRKPGTHAGFAYSTAMTDFGSKHAVWDYDDLYVFLKNPGADVVGTKMTFAGITKPEDRINLIAWLRTQNDSPPPIPAPKPKAAAPAAAPAGAVAASGAPAASTSTPANSTNAPVQAPKSGPAAAATAVKSPGSAPG